MKCTSSSDWQSLVSAHIGVYDTFKEARKHAREVARLRGRHGYIKVKYYIKSGKTCVRFMVLSEPYDFDYYVSIDGRVCSVSELEKERLKWKRHPECAGTPYPFVYKVRNRETGEDKQSYLREMSVTNRCPY